MVDDDLWRRVWAAVQELSELYPEHVIVIGGVAVYLHARAAGLPEEFTHDADISISRHAFSDLRDTYEVVSNLRLHKSSISIQAVDIDVYVERAHRLRVDYPDLALGAVVVDGVRIAGLEHLLLLKLTAWRDRRASAHGDKDRRDVAKLLVLLHDTAPHFLLAQGDEEDLRALQEIAASKVFLDLTDGDAHAASKLKKRAARYVERLTEASA